MMNKMKNTMKKALIVTLFGATAFFSVAATAQAAINREDINKYYESQYEVHPEEHPEYHLEDHY